MPAEPDKPLNILHVLRAPVGGLFRHVSDLVRGQWARGHHVGIIADSNSGGAAAEAAFAKLIPFLRLGLTRLPMSRHLDVTDIAAVRTVGRQAAEQSAQVLHGHGAKGGAYARLARQDGALRVYTPHGGSLHYRWLSPVGAFYLLAERQLLPRTDLILFESAYGREAFHTKVGSPAALERVVYNGVTPADLIPVEPGPRATDLLFVGELRALKGVDVLIEAIAALARDGRVLTVTIVGEGPDEAAFRAKASGLGEAVRFAGALPAREAFALGRLLVVPSRAESLPYIVLEAAAASMPMIASDVGGVGEIFGPDAASLVPAGDAAALAAAIIAALSQVDDLRTRTARLHARIAEQFSAETMTDGVLAGYGAALLARKAQVVKAR